MSHPTPPGWFPGDAPGTERWWDGVRWTAHVRPAPGAAQPVHQGPPTEHVQLERIRWAGVHWGSATSETSIAFGVIFVLLGLPPVALGLLDDTFLEGALALLFGLTLLLGAAAFFVNAHFCRILERRRRDARRSGVPQAP